MADVDRLERYSLKIFAEPPSAVVPRAVIPVFHRWIQQRAVDGLLIDVADYTHLVDGPSVLLVAHEANYVVDGAGGRPGLAYVRKRDGTGPLARRLTASGRALLTAGRLLEAETAAMPDGPFAFRGDEIEFIANDRLGAPATDETEAALRATVVAFADRLFGDPAVEVSSGREAERIRVTVRATRATPLAELLATLA